MAATGHALLGRFLLLWHTLRLKRLLLIGIGAGDPDHLILQAAKAIAAADVFFIVGKGEVKHDLIQLRPDLIAEHGRAPYRIAEARDPLTPAHCSFAGLDGYSIHWGAYLGTPDEILVSGPVSEVGERIRELRAQARAREGWIMDTYLLRRDQP